ncbi:MAG: tetratricopeptide repeat protein [Pleurocapsa sp. MO_226.B13]|nr:tetratricopeptide repeat protein [Pleurocapsa sp. MO_226.B13]
MAVFQFLIKQFFLISCSVFVVVSVTTLPLKAQISAENQNQTFSSPEALNLLERGRQKFQSLDYQGAIADLNQSILLNPEIADSYYYRGLIRVQLEDRRGAISDFDDAILRNPRHSWAYYHRAGVFFNLGNQSEAILDLQLAAQLFSEQGNRSAYQQTTALLLHFGIKPEGR